MKKSNKMKIGKVKITRKKILLFYALIVALFLAIIIFYAISIYYSEAEVPPAKKDSITINEKEINRLDDLENLSKEINTRAGIGKNEPFK